MINRTKNAGGLTSGYGNLVHRFVPTRGGSMMTQYEMLLGRAEQPSLRLMINVLTEAKQASLTILPSSYPADLRLANAIFHLLGGSLSFDIFFCIMIGHRPCQVSSYRPSSPQQLHEQLGSGFGIHVEPKWPGTSLVTVLNTVSILSSLNGAESNLRGESQRGSARKLEAREVVQREKELAQLVKEIHGFRCQICMASLPTPSGQGFVEAHHIIPLAEGGPDTIENMMALCPNCHRLMHIWKGTGWLEA